MARILGKLAGKVVKKYNNLTQDTAGVLTGPINKLWRAKIHLNRLTSSLPKDTAPRGKLFNPNGALGERERSSKNPVINSSLQSIRRLQLQHGNIKIDRDDPAQGRTVVENNKLYGVSQDIRKLNQVIIYNTNVSPYQYIVLQNRPLSFDFRGETTWATIKSMGRNTPMYHYTGSEDIVQFNVSWYCDDPDNPAEVLTKCRLLESWSKSNAYQAAPPILQIQWGNSDTFEGHYYILTSATYSLSNFRNASRQRMRGSVDIRKDLNLYPATATQELIFKRVSSYSLSYEDIVKSKAAEKTVGIFTTDKIK